MKNVLTIVALTIYVSMNAQIEKGTFMAGGSLTFNYRIPQSGASGTSIFSVNPNFGYFLFDNFAAGTGAGYYSISSQSGYRFNQFYVSPFLRYYVKKLYLQTKFDYGRSGTNNYYALNFDLGYALFLTDNVALEPSFYYRQAIKSQRGELGFKMGLQIYFNR